MVSCYVINIKKLAITDGAGNGVNATQVAKPVGSVPGLLYLLPNPALRG
jgi:hypothetical protein